MSVDFVSLIRYAISILLILNELQHSVDTLVPTICAKNATKSADRICCPTNPMNGLVCGGRNRGQCVYFELPVDFPHVDEDARLFWPVNYFDYICECFGGFFGFSCDKCWLGLEGPECNQKAPLKVRRDIRSYSDREKLELMLLFRKSKDYVTEFSIPNELKSPLDRHYWFPATMYHLISSIHHYASRATMGPNCGVYKSNISMNFNHEGPGFPLWHRYFMLFWENLFEEVAKDILGVESFTFPFWDWTDKISCEICTNNLVGSVGLIDEWGMRLHENSPFFHEKEYCPYPWVWNFDAGCFACEAEKRRPPLTRQWMSNIFPPFEDIERLLSIKPYIIDNNDTSTNMSCSFSGALEGGCPSIKSHNHVHNIVNGTFCCSPTSPSDPFFPFHHTQIDRLLQKWFMKNQPREEELPIFYPRPGHCRNCLLVGFFPPVKTRDMFVDTRDIGYTYEHFEFGKNYPIDRDGSYIRKFIDMIREHLIMK